MFSQFGNSHYFYRWLREISYILPVHKIRFKARKTYIIHKVTYFNTTVNLLINLNHSVGAKFFRIPSPKVRFPGFYFHACRCIVYLLDGMKIAAAAQFSYHPGLIFLPCRPAIIGVPPLPPVAASLVTELKLIPNERVFLFILTKYIWEFLGPQLIHHIKEVTIVSWDLVKFGG